MRTHLMRYAILASLGGITIPAFAADDATDTLVNIQLPDGLVEEIQQALPERADVNQEFLNTNYDPNLSFQTDAHVAITFLDEGAGYKNSLGYFTYGNDTFNGFTFADGDTNGNGYIGISELKDIDGVAAEMIFSNASEYRGGGKLLPGDTVALGDASIVNVNGTDFEMTGGETFGSDTNMGFFLMQNAAAGNSGLVKGWDITNLDPKVFYTVDFLNPENSPTATEDNPAEYSRHVAMMNSVSADNDIIIGFEDLVRPGGDNDFNDAVFRVRTDPTQAMFAVVPTSMQVVAMQAAPAPLAGNGASGMMMLAASMLFIYRRRKTEKA